MSPPVQALNVLTLPLLGRQVIEASAGTGKTWTLAALYLRLVLGVGRSEPLLPPHILVMTFTEAATAELRQRIRARLAEACAWFRNQPLHAPDAFLQELRAAFDPTTWPACAHRLDLAAQWMDDAAIFTIHGWSHRMLREHAFESRSLFEQHAVDDGDTLWRAVAQDYWRQTYYPLPAEAAALVEQLVADPDTLLRKTQALRAQAERSPLPQDDEPAAPAPLLAEAVAWQQTLEALQQPARAAWMAWAVEGRHALWQATSSKQLKGYSAWLEGWLAKMDAWAAGEGIDAKTLVRFTVATLQDKWTCAPDLSALAALDDLHQHLQTKHDPAPALLAHAAWALRHAYAERKAQLAQFDFNDLLQRLYHAVRAPDGALALAIRRQYPVALVDEFQDTDPWQYGALDAIYPQPVAEIQPDPADGTALVMIGDPKQAIYSFRGADLATYLKARAAAQGIHTLDGNHRSTPALVGALNHVFTLADSPFGDIDYPPVQARRQDLQPLLDAQGQARPAMTVWHTPLDAPLNATQADDLLAEAFASQMVDLLRQGVAQPWEMAVLVRHGGEAARVREALAQRGVKSVYLSERNSVFATAEAHDLWRLLRAVLEPRRGDLLRAALACRVWGWPLQQVAALQADEAQWETWLERFLAWQAVWRSQGVLPMLYRWLHEAQIAARLLQQDPATGERRLTNLLQLGEWLQHAATTQHGETALLRCFEQHLRRPELGGESAQLRLESDDELVKVVTMHKSKGLQYPLVFLPFVSGFRRVTSDSNAAPTDSDEIEGDDDTSPVAEDIRLLYVALTRAERGLWLGVAPRAKEFSKTHPAGQSALSHLLGRQSADDLATCLGRWAEHPHIGIEPLPPATLDCYPGNAQALQYHPACQPQRRLSSHWWTASFSALARPQTGASAQEGWAEERWLDAQCDQTLLQEATATNPAAVTAYNTFPAGSRYGTLLHDLLEWQAREGWPLADTTLPPAFTPEQHARHAAWQTWLTTRCETVALPAEAQTQLEPWLHRLLTQTLPVADAPLALADLAPAQLWPEMAFTLPAQATPAPWLDQRIQHHTWPGQPRLPLAPRTLNGMLTGFMDVVFEHQGRYYVLDYKSNKLPDYGQAALVEAMLEHRYDVQLTLYLLALHRLLRARLPGYDYDQHVGGAVYLFLRGIDAPGAGTVHVRPPRVLIETLDARLRGEGA